MRPVNKPTPPKLIDADAAPTQLDPLTRLRMQLQDTIGYYCSLCEMPITVTQAVASKHVRTFKRLPTQNDWSDLLLACDYCQVHRTSDIADLRNYLWPDTDATFSLGTTSPFLYERKSVNFVIKSSEGSTPELSSTKEMVIIVANPASPEAARAQKTIDLFQLNTPFYDAKTNTYTITSDALAAGVDQRVERRTAAWDIAGLAIKTLREAQALTAYPIAFENVGKLTAGLAQSTGFWSVWMTRLWREFADQKLIVRSLLTTATRDGYQVIGYQTEPDGGSPPWTIFTGTAVERATFT